MVNEPHSDTGFFSTSILNDFMMRNDRNQEKDAVMDCTRSQYLVGTSSVLMNHGMGPRPNRKADINVHRKNSTEILHGEPASIPAIKTTGYD